MNALFICGPAGAGKDTVCEWFKAAGIEAESTSRFFLDYCVEGAPMDRDVFAAIHGDNWRVVLAGMILQYNVADGSDCRLYLEMIDEGLVQAVNGIRRLRELRACVDAGLVSEIWWIDAAERLKDKPPDTTLDYGLADAAGLGVRFRVIDSNGTVKQLIKRVKEVLSDGVH